MSKLLPCPLCGEDVRLVDAAGWEVWCACGIELCLGAPDKGPLIAAWNRRAARCNDTAPVSPIGTVEFDQWYREQYPGFPHDE